MLKSILRLHAWLGPRTETLPTLDKRTVRPAVLLLCCVAMLRSGSATAQTPASPTQPTPETPATQGETTSQSLKLEETEATGALVGIVLPAETNGDWVSLWLGALHTAAVWGTPYRVLVSLLGGTIATLSVTGIVIWLRKRRAVASSEQHRAEVAALLAGKQAERAL